MTGSGALTMNTVKRVFARVAVTAPTTHMISLTPCLVAAVVCLAAAGLKDPERVKTSSIL